LVSSIAALKTLETAGLKPVAVAGHSLGEYSALVAAGGVSFRDAVGLVQKRGRYMSEAVPPGTGQVAALLKSADVAIELIRENRDDLHFGFMIWDALIEKWQGAIYERSDAAAIELAKGKGCKKAIPLPVSVPVHTPLMQVAADRLSNDLAAVKWTDLAMPLINNAEAKPISRAAEIQPSLVRQLPSSVLWEDSVQAMAKMGVTTFIEVGPGTVLTGLIKRILPDAKLLNVHDPKSLDATLQALGAAHPA